MRKILSFVGWLAFAGLTVAQAPAAGQAVAPPAIDPANSRLDALLAQWEQKMGAVTGLEAEVTRTETDNQAKTSKVMQGRVKLRRPEQAFLRLNSPTNPDIYEQYVFTGAFLYEYRPQNKIIRIHEMAAKPGQVVQDNFLNFLFGMKAADAKKRYSLSLHGEDQHYVYILVEPKLAADAQDFKKARLVLLKSTYLPRQLEFDLPTGHERIKWDIPRADPAARFGKDDFVAPQPPKDWRVEKIPAQPAPGANPVPPPATPQPTKVRPAGGG